MSKLMNKQLLVVGILLLSLGSLTACAGSDANSDGDQISTEVENVQLDENGEVILDDQGNPIPIEVENKVKSIDAYGTVTATTETTINVDFNAKVEKIYVQQGEVVNEGTPLVDFDISNLKNDISSKKRDLAQYRQKLNQKDYDVEKLELSLSNETMELVQLETELTSKKALLDGGAVSQDEYTRFKDSVEMKRNGLKNTELTISSTKESLKNSNQELQNQVTRLSDELEQLEESYTKSNFQNDNQIVSNIKNGVITEVGVKEGANINRDINVLTIVDLDSRIVTANIAEEFIGKINIGQSVTLVSQSNPEFTYEGTVSRIWGSSVRQGGETVVPIEITVDNIDDKLYLNFNVDVKIVIE